MAFFSFLSWFRPWWKTSETDYETILSRLTKDISSVENRLVKINQRERRASVTLTFYAALLWLLYAVGVWFWTSESRLSMTKAERLRLWSPAALGFLFIVSTRLIVRFWYRKIAEGEETHLRSLQRTRRKKIDEIKAATRYDHLRSLLEKYDDTAGGGRISDGRKVQSNGSPAHGRAPNKRPADPVTPKQPNRASSLGKSGTAGAASTQSGEASNLDAGAGAKHALLGPSVDGRQVQLAIPSQKIQTQSQRHWLDRVADKVLGAEAGGQEVKAEQRYALICRICFTHNGLCPKEEWEEVQYICPRCGTFNSRRPSTQPTSSPWSKKDRVSSEQSSIASRPVTPSPSASPFKRNTDLPDEKEENRNGDEEEEEEEEEEEILEDEVKASKLRNRRRPSRFRQDNDSMEVD